MLVVPMIQVADVVASSQWYQRTLGLVSGHGGDEFEMLFAAEPYTSPLVLQLHRWDARWEDWFHATGREPIRVIYEEFTDTRAATVGRVLDALGVDPREPDGDKGPMRRQADELSRDWVSRFRDDDESRELLV